MSEADLITTVREVGRNYRELSDVVGGVVDAVKNLKPLIGEPTAEAKSSRLISVGLAIIALPEPTLVTDIAGSALVAAGLVKNRMKPTSVADMMEKFEA